MKLKSSCTVECELLHIGIALHAAKDIKVIILLTQKSIRLFQYKPTYINEKFTLCQVYDLLIKTELEPTCFRLFKLYGSAECAPMLNLTELRYSIRKF